METLKGSSIKVKAILILAVVAAIVAVACGVRAYSDAQEAAAEEAAQAALEESIDVEGFAVSQLNETAIEMLGGEDATKALQANIAVWSARNTEGATSAAWNQKINCDFKAGTVGLGFTLDDAAKTQITVMAWPETNRIIISKGVSA